MNIFKIIFELFILYILYKVIFDFIIPVYQATRQIKQKMSNMQNQADGHKQQNQGRDFKNMPSNGDKPNQADYIDFEEVK